MNSGIYAIVNTENCKVYIGSTTRLNIRKNQHWHLLRKNKHGNQHLQHSWNKYGESFFEFRIIELCPENKLINREDYWIKYYNSLDRKLGYNIEKANRIKFSEEHRKNLSIAIKKIYFNKIWTEEYRNNCRNRMLGKKMSEETKQKMIKKLTGRPVSLETRIKIGKSNSLKIKREDGIEYESIINAAKSLNCSPSLIVRSLKKGCNARGYKWSYI